MAGRPRVVLFGRDLRVHDHPALAAACAAAAEVVPLFVVDPALPAGANRRAFLAGALADLRRSLRQRGADLVVRRGDPAAEAVRVATEVGASGVEATADVSAFAAARQRRLTEVCTRQRLAFVLHPGVTVVPPGALRPSGGEHYQVFTPYWRVWQRQRWRDEADPPARIRLPDHVTGADPAAHLPPTGRTSPDLVDGGESAARRLLTDWAGQVHRYDRVRDDLAAAGTSRLSAYLHFGCVSPRTVAAACAGHPPFLRQLCWRDFYTQLLAAFPDLPYRAYRRTATEQWREDADALAAWQSGRTGMPIVDAGMRQLAHEGFLHNRARLITASYLIRTLGLDWRAGAKWYADLLVDADVANNNGNWQWVAGTGTDARPQRGFNPLRQARRFDPDGQYVRRWVPELAGLAGPEVHQPWRLPPANRRQIRYPPPIAGVPERS